jgi:hypothetical protein
MIWNYFTPSHVRNREAAMKKIVRTKIIGDREEMEKEAR